LIAIGKKNNNKKIDTPIGFIEIEFGPADHEVWITCTRI
jgi:hypothetical protein